MNRIQTQVTPIIEPKISKLFVIREQIRVLQKDEKELTADVVSYLEGQRLSELIVGNVRALLSSAKKFDIDASQFRSKVNETQFISCVSVSVTKARDFLSECDIEKISSASRFNQLRLSEVKKS